ncbi:hypothetical protein BJV82DRAFT_714040 [Fennellomyces sp. T-0311]|nr:hypothetical protein BJV82DRAFT_714040 [Fennellomyces sp. T-0311]
MRPLYAYLLVFVIIGIILPITASSVNDEREVDGARDDWLAPCRRRNKDNEKRDLFTRDDDDRFDDDHSRHKDDVDYDDCPKSTVYEYSDDPKDIYGAQTVTPQMGVAGAVLILLGCYLMVFGYRCFRPTLAVSGFLTFGLITWIGMANSQSARGYTNNAITMIAVPAGLGILGAVLYASFLWNVSIYLVGGMGGLAFGLFICCWREDLVVRQDVPRACFLIAIAVFFAALTFFLERYVILFSSSFVGGYTFIVGIDFIAHTGYTAGIKSIIDHNQLHRVKYIIDKRVYGIMSVIIVLFLISFGWQFYYNRDRRFGVNVTPVKKVDDGEGAE